MSFNYGKGCFLFFCVCLLVTMIALLTLFIRPEFSICDCGYVVNIDRTLLTFTEVLETDFTQVSNISTNPYWIRQEFNKTKERTSGPFGQIFAVENIYTSPGITNDSKHNQSAGLQLAVNATLVDGMVLNAEIDSARTDMYYGSYRARIKLSGISGSCSAFFWYSSDNAEIDIEFLSKDYNLANNTYPVNLILHDSTSNTQPKSAKIDLPFDPTADFHEYGFDFLPSMVFFFADGQLLAQLDGTKMPALSGHLVLQHWSNGDSRWSGGPPAEDTLMQVAYVKAYFNSSSSPKEASSETHCPSPDVLKRVCRIPEVTPDNQTATGIFVTHQSNAFHKQIPYKQYWSMSISLLVIIISIDGLY